MTLTLKKTNEIKNYKKIILNEIEKLKNGENCYAKKISEKYKIDLVLVISVLLKAKCLKNEKYGEYTKI